MCVFPQKAMHRASYWTHLGSNQSVACNMNITALSGTDSIHETLEAFRSKACLSALCEGKERWSRGIAKALCLHLQGPCQVRGSWSQMGIGRSQHRGTMARQGGESSDQNSVKWMWASCKAKMSLIRQECWRHKQLLMGFTHVQWLQRDAGAGCSALCTSADQALQAPHQKRSPVTQRARAAYTRRSLSFMNIIFGNRFSNVWPATPMTRLTLTYLGTLRADMYFSGLKPVLRSQLGTKMWKGELSLAAPGDQWSRMWSKDAFLLPLF